MKLVRVSNLLFTPLLLVCAYVVVGVGIDSWRHLHLVYASPETESAFLKSYNPEQVIDRFIENLPHSYAHDMSTGTGREFAPRQGGFQFYVVMRREEWIPLMDALKDDVQQRLTNSGAEVLSVSGDSGAGFHFDYKISKSVGSLTISPIVNTWPPVADRKFRLPEAMEDVTVKIQQTEKWFPNEAGEISAVRQVTRHLK